MVFQGSITSISPRPTLVSSHEKQDALSGEKVGKDKTSYSEEEAIIN